MNVFDKKVPKQGQKSWSDPALLKPEDSSVESSAKLAKKWEHAPHSDWRQRRDAAIRRYHQRGLCPIPLKGKRPYQKGWQAQEQYQELSAEAILQRFRPSDNVGLLLGIPWRQRGLFLRGIDYDDLDLWKEHMDCASDQEGYGWLLSGPLVRTGNGNSHHYILSDSPEKFVFQGKESTEHGGEIQGAGTQLVAPPSIHPDTGEEYRWIHEDWEDLVLVSQQQLQENYHPKTSKSKFTAAIQPAQRKRSPFSSSDAGDFSAPPTLYDYSSIDWIALFGERGWFVRDNGDHVTVLCPNKAQHTNGSDGTSSTVILRTPGGGQRFNCKHGHCEHLSDRDQLIELLGGPSVLEGFAKKLSANSESTSAETKGLSVTHWLRLDPRNGLYHIRQPEAARAFRATGVQLDDPELEQKLLHFLEKPPGGEPVGDTLSARILADVLKLVRTDGGWGTRLRLQSASKLPLEAIDWLWQGWLARGKFHLLAGSPGTGKTTLAMEMAAIISRGGTWPEGANCAPANVLIWSGEDDPQDTLVPRLVLAEADLERIYFVNEVHDGQGSRSFDPATDLRLLEMELKQIGGVSLLIADPVVSAVTGDSHRNTEVRRALQPLVDLASVYDCAVLGITHFSKGTQLREPLERVTGSIAFGALARIVLGTVVVPGDLAQASQRMLLRLKSNIGVDQDGFSYDLQQVELPNHPGISNTRVVWGAAVVGSAQQILGAAEEQRKESGAGQSALNEAKDFLRDLLAAAPMTATKVKQAAQEADIAPATLRRARQELEISVDKKGGPSQTSWWEWRLLPPGSFRAC